MATNFINKVFRDKVGRVIEWRTITSSAAMTVVEIPVCCNVYIASFICGPAMQYAPKAGGTSLDQKWRASTWWREIGAVQGGLEFRYVIATLLEKHLKLSFDLNLQDVEPLNSITETPTKWVLNKLTLPKLVSSNSSM